MSITPIVKKVLSSIAIKASSSEEGKKAMLFISLIPVVAVLLILCLLTYILSSPLGFLLNLLGINTGEVKAAIENYKSQNDTVIALPIGTIMIQGKYAMPVSGSIEIDYGNGSDGIVFSATPDSEVLGIANNGQVVSSGTDNKYGQYVIIKYDEPGETFYCLYGYLSRLDTMQDQEIRQGSIIGRSTDKLYFEIRTSPDSLSCVDPKLYILPQEQSTDTSTPTPTPEVTVSPSPSPSPTQ